jgi:ubiquinone/menaquinone biosynthesis C-methylase UbiE
MMSSASGEPKEVARYFDEHAVDFDSIYEEREGKGWLRFVRDRLSRSTVVERLAFVDAFAQALTPGRALDVGCGSGRFAIRLAEQGWNATGLDFAPEMIALANQRAAAADLAEHCSFLAEDFMTWEPTAKFDLSMAIGVFDYVAQPGPLLARLADVTDGTVIASFPKLVHPLVPLRWARLTLSRCPVHFYRRQQVLDLGREHLENAKVLDFHRDYLLLGDG